MDLEDRDFLSLGNYTPTEVEHLLSRASDIKQNVWSPVLNATLAMVFQKRSTRTRVSFETGMNELSGDAVFLSEDDLQLGRGETIADTARSLSRYVDGVMARVYSHNDVEEIAQHSTVPVINGLSDYNHPCQALADLLTIQELKGFDASVAWVGDGNNVCHSLLHACSKVGLNIKVATPEEYEANPEVVRRSEKYASESGCKVRTTNDPIDAVTEADVVYTDSWVSMGDDDKDLSRFSEFQVNEELVGYAADDYVFMHCLPAHRGREVTDGVIDGSHSVVWEQAENRLHTQKALLALLI